MVRSIVRYAVPLLALGGVTAGFLCARRFKPLGPRARLALAGVAALPLVASGTLHLVRPSAFVPLLPAWVPGRVPVIVATGLPELLGAAGLFYAPRRRAAATCLAIFMIAIFPANVYVAGRQVQGLAMPGVPVRTAMQAGYIVLLLIVGYGWPEYAPGKAAPGKPAAGKPARPDLSIW